MLQFFGRANGLSKEHSNSAFFEHNNDLVLVDCSMDTCRSMFQMNVDKYENIYVLITHTHSDHVGGIGMLSFYLWYHHKKKLNIVVPEELEYSIQFFMNSIEGVNIGIYHIMIVDEFAKQNKDLNIEAVKTEHTPELVNKCFGYVFTIAGHRIVYTGDTNTLRPFEKYLTNGAILYTEISTFNSGVHLYLKTILPFLKLLTYNGIAVYLMHIDDIDTVERKISGTDIKIVSLWQPNRVKKVIVINGKGGCGKDTLIDGLKDYYRILNVSSIDRIKDIARQCGWVGTKDNKSRAFLSELKRLCIDFNDLPLSEMLTKYKQFKDDNNELMFVHIREGVEIDKFKKVVPCKTLLIRRNKTDSNDYGNKSDDGVESYDYDYYFDNCGDIGVAQGKFKEFIDSIL